MRANFDSDTYVPYSGIGSLVPHVVTNDSSLRALFQKLCYEHGKPLNFLVALDKLVTERDISSFLTDLHPDGTLVISKKGSLLPPEVRDFRTFEVDHWEQPPLAAMLQNPAEHRYLLYRSDGHLLNTF